ncbi:hypothetical protein E2C01_012546 [Portunus trituberculatus]|uniref:Uncharacterized protein n=1 Tax=Portunus trituberculatus TaxID=210409 RepID=A0A5B7DEW5_PORTR|nr:hypothetical protein [Portunus trituberculatus]
MASGQSCRHSEVPSGRCGWLVESECCCVLCSSPGVGGWWNVCAPVCCVPHQVWVAGGRCVLLCVVLLSRCGWLVEGVSSCVLCSSAGVGAGGRCGLLCVVLLSRCGWVVKGVGSCVLCSSASVFLIRCGWLVEGVGSCVLCSSAGVGGWWKVWAPVSCAPQQVWVAGGRTVENGMHWIMELL